MSIFASFSRRFAAMDPGRLRISQAASVAAGMAITALGAWAAVHFLKAPAPLLPIGILLSMLMGQMAKGPTAPARCITTALMIVPVAVSAIVIALLADYRPVQIVFLICAVAAGTWVRQFGARWSSLGAGAFFGSFFTLLLHISVTELPFFLLIAGIAVGSQTLISAWKIRSQPRKHIQLLLREVRSVSASALVVAQHTDSVTSRRMISVLSRLDSVSLAVHTWQKQFSTEHNIGCDETTLSTLVLDARMLTEQVVAVLTASGVTRHDLHSGSHSGSHSEALAALNDLNLIVDNSSSVQQVAEARQRSDARYRGVSPSDAQRVLLGIVSRCAVAHAKLRGVDLVHPLSVAEVVSDESAQQTVSPTPGSQKPQVRFWQWRQWSPNTRFAVQITVAVTIATVVGEFISASRWYWAVLTVFVIFMGGSSRGAILTKAYRRVIGTLGGLSVGVALVLLAHDNKVLIGVIAVVAAFLMMYLGPIKYSYLAFFVSIMLVGLYALLGELNTTVLLYRVEETAAGCVIGVVCAYLIVSANTHPQFVSHISNFFQNIRELLGSVQQAMIVPNSEAALLHRVALLDAALADATSFASSVATVSFTSQRPSLQQQVHLMSLCTHAADQLAATALNVTAQQPAHTISGSDVQVLDDVFSHVQQTAELAESSFQQPAAIASGTDTYVLDRVPQLPFAPESAQVHAFTDLSRVNWVLLQIAQKNSQRKAR